MCCVALPLTSIGKKQDERCQHQKHRKGCAIYGDLRRPTSCVVWSCQWRRDASFPGGRPDRCGYFVDPNPSFVTLGENAIAGEASRAVTIYVDPRRPLARRDPTLLRWLEEHHPEHVAVVWAGTMSHVMLPPARSDTGTWQEIANRTMTPQTVGEINRNMVNERLRQAEAQNVSRETPGEDA